MITKQITYNKYRAYKDSGVEWLGEIPEGWRIYRFRNIFSFSKGLNITKENLQEKGTPCISYGEVHSIIENGMPEEVFERNIRYF